MRVCFSFVANVCAKIVVCVVPRACAKDCGIAAHTCCGIAAPRNQLAALPRDRKYVGCVAACSGIAAIHTTCTHVRGDAIFAQPQLHTKVLAIVESATQPRGQSSNIWAQWPQAIVPWILLWVGFPIKILAAMPWYVHVLVLLLVALLILLRLSPPQAVVIGLVLTAARATASRASRRAKRAFRSRSCEVRNDLLAVGRDLVRLELSVLMRRRDRRDLDVQLCRAC